MAEAKHSAIRFGVYEADLSAGELRKNGIRVKLADQPFQTLCVLLERPGEIVTREELKKRLWASDTFVDFEHGLNKAMNRLREALRDSADRPRFVETIPKRGYRFIAELEPNETTSPDRLVSQIGSAPTPQTFRRPEWFPRALIFGMALAFAAAILTGWSYLRKTREPLPLLRTSVLPPPNSAFQPRNFTLSPDGSRLIFSALSTDGKGELWIRALSASRAHPLDDTGGAAYPFWSPDGRRVGFFADRRLKIVDVETGVVTLLTDTPIASGGTWNADNVIIFAGGIGQPLYRVSASGGQPTPVTRVSPGRTAQTSSWPYFLPDGKHFLYSVQWTVPGEGTETGLYAGSIGSDREKLVSSEISGNVAFASGRLLFGSGGRIMAAPFDPDRVNFTGPPVSITDQEIETEAIFLQTGFSAASNGALIFESTDDFASHLVWFESSGRELGQIPQSGYRSPSLSPNGRMVAVACDEARNGSHSICTYDLDRGVSTRVTNGLRDTNPIWSSDGREITYESREQAVAHVQRVAIDRPGPPSVVMQGGRLSPAAWLKDGRLLVGRVEEGESRMYIASGGQASLLWPGAEAQLSPDGNWIAQAGVVVRSLGDPNIRIQVANDGTQPRWSHDGRELFYIAPDKKMIAVAFDPRTGKVGAPRVLFQTRIVGTRIVGTQYDVTADGRFLINSLPTGPSPLTLMTGWERLLKQ